MHIGATLGVSESNIRVWHRGVSAKSSPKTRDASQLVQPEQPPQFGALPVTGLCVSGGGMSVNSLANAVDCSQRPGLGGRRRFKESDGLFDSQINSSICFVPVPFAT